MQRTLLVLTMLFALVPTANVWGQSFGIELLNNVMPRSGAMGGASLARPQDVQSAINGNPATLTQFGGTQFSFGSLWIEPTINLEVAAPGLPAFGVSPFSQAKSDAQGVAGGNIGVTQDFNAWGLPVTLGLGLFAGSGAGNDYRHIPESNGTYAALVALDTVMAAGVDLTDRVSVGGQLVVTGSTLSGPFVGVTGASTDYAIRGGLGINFELTPERSVGLMYKTNSGFTFENLAGLDPPGPTPFGFFDVDVERPHTVGIGYADNSLLDGRLLLAVDTVYLMYGQTDLFGAVYVDQLAVQVGAQYAANERVKIRAGYAWNENPMRDVVGDGAGGILPPGGADHIQYVQSLFAAISQHRVTGGVTVHDVLPGVDMDFFAGGMFGAEQTFGVTTARIESYWVGTAFTWRFGRGSCEDDSWY